MELNIRDAHDHVAVNSKVDTHEAIHDEKKANQGRRPDQAGAFLQSHTRRDVSAAENKHIVKKIDLRLLPILLLIYFLQQLDKSALSYSSVFGLLEDAHLVGQQYSWLGSVIYIAQLVMQPLIAYFLVRFPTGKFLAGMVVCWGAIQAWSVVYTCSKVLLTDLVLAWRLLTTFTGYVWSNSRRLGRGVDKLKVAYNSIILGYL